jgi:hypothetical protein
MQRAEEQVVNSYLKWTDGKNHWMLHDGREWKYDRWDKAYPKFSATDKSDALHQYWTFYADTTAAWQARLPDQFKIVDLEDFNSRECRESILDFIGYTGIRKSDTPVIMNAISERKSTPKNNALLQRLIEAKRVVLGRPGHRWFLGQRSKSSSQHP